LGRCCCFTGKRKEASGSFLKKRTKKLGAIATGAGKNIRPNGKEFLLPFSKRSAFLLLPKLNIEQPFEPRLRVRLQSARGAIMAHGLAQPGVKRKAPAESDGLLRAALDCARPGLMVLDRAMRVRLLTRSAADLLGVVVPRGTALPVMRLMAQSQFLDEPALQTLAAAFVLGEHTEPRELLFSLPRPGGSRVIAMDLRRVGREGFVASLEDVTSMRETQDWLLEHAATDPVTGLWNRQHFMLMLRDRLETPQEDGPTVLLLDLQRFRPVNESLGSEAGDCLLRLVGSRLAGFLRENDVLARFASDEFAILVPDVAEHEAIAGLSARLGELIARPFVIEGQMLSIACHIGAACAPDDGEAPDVLLANAGLALAAARAEARGAFRFYEKRLDEQARTRRSLEADLRQALGRDEFELHYQPQVDVQHRLVTGFEALLRWRSVTRGLVPPNDFIPVAEDIGLIGDIGAWVLRAACREAMQWPPHLTVAVNASPLQVESGGFADAVRAALDESGLAAARLEIEITENLLLRDNGVVGATFAALRAMGVRLVLDDFGTGYASLSQLARFHFDRIKIDRGFISAPDAAAEHAAIVRAIAALGSSLGVPTTAEGVETEQQLARVVQDGCTSVQGYYFSRPVPADAVATLLQKFAPVNGRAPFCKPAA
jgi:diguanylate cyclase (GGDEF)-like protein